MHGTVKRGRMEEKRGFEKYRIPGNAGISVASSLSKMAYTINNRATELIKELKRSDWIPKYNVWDSFRCDGKEDGINTVLDEMDNTMEKIIDTYMEMEEAASEIPDAGDEKAME